MPSRCVRSKTVGEQRSGACHDLECRMVAFGNSILNGYTACTAEFPNADVATLTTLREHHKTARLTQSCLVAGAKLEALADVMRVPLEQSEVDVAANPEALRLIRSGPVRTYVVERGEQPAGDWSIASTEGTNAVRRVSEATEAHLTNQPRGQQLEYRIRAHNLAGTGPPSNTAACVL